MSNINLDHVLETLNALTMFFKKMKKEENKMLRAEMKSKIKNISQLKGKQKKVGRPIKK
jgi:hypothetical protein